ncbi:DUF3180 family protein [Leucobacter sp. gxy201]|uniref:DUF3180 family protein n=1 Tax=Leucobacter sp. gxy201 TaxID=2957200 RepID=UPI003DA01E43
MNPQVTAAAAAMGAAVGLVVEFALSGRGAAPFVPPISLPVTLALISAVLVCFGVRLRRTIAKRPGAVNPFHAVRLLAAARAGQLVGALLGGLGGGFALSLIGRTVPAPVEMWLPMVLTLAAGAALVVCAAITEHLCRVPPSDDPDGDGDDAAPGRAEGTAYRKQPDADLR